MKRETIKKGSGGDDLALLLTQRLRLEGLEDVKVEANTVDVPSGQLAAVYLLTFPDSLPDDRKLEMSAVTLEECASYLHTSHNSKNSAPN